MISRRVFDLSDPKQARDYLAISWPEVTFVQLDNGQQVDFDVMTDAEAVLIARQMHDVQMVLRGLH